MTKEIITRKATELWQKYEERDPRLLCKWMDIRIIDLPMGNEENSIRGMIIKNNRCYCIVINSDLSEKEQNLILFHEIGHYCLGHADKSACSYRGANYQISDEEIEANEFIAEYLLDTEETLAALRETNSFYYAASIMHVPEAIMSFKWQMLRYYHLISAEVPTHYKSDCMGHLDYDVEEFDSDP